MPSSYDSINDPNVWQDAGTTPPHPYNDNGNQTDGRFYWNTTTPIVDQQITYIGLNTLPPVLKFVINITVAPDAGDQLYLLYIDDDGSGQSVALGNAVGQQVITITDHERLSTGTPFSYGISDSAVAYNGIDSGSVALAGANTAFNSEWSVADDAETLSTLRNRLLARTGYAAQLASLPPGVSALYDDFLLSAQRHLYRYFKALQTERFFTYQLEVGDRYLTFGSNIDGNALTLDPRKITGAWIQDLNDRWYPLGRGIDPARYTLANNTGWPSSFEARDVFELFPAPQARYLLRVKGSFGLQAFAADGDYTTIDAEAVFLWALGLAKLEKGDRDAGDPTRMTGYFGQARQQVLKIVASGHSGRRYIPKDGRAINRAQPTMVEFIS